MNTEDPDMVLRVTKSELAFMLDRAKDIGLLKAISALGFHRCEGIGGECSCIKSATDAALWLNSNREKLLAEAINGQ